MLNELINILETCGDKPHLSICKSLKRESEKMYRDYLNTLFKEWPLFSGDGSYPVPHPTLSCYSGYWQASDTGKMWVGEYGENRKALVKFLIERLSQ